MSKPARLHKIEEDDYHLINSFLDRVWNKVEGFILAHATLFLLVFMAFLIAMFVVLMFAIIGVSATDSGTVYNQFNNIV